MSTETIALGLLAGLDQLESALEEAQLLGLVDEAEAADLLPPAEDANDAVGHSPHVIVRVDAPGDR